MPPRPLIDDDVAWAKWADHWSLRRDTIYLNHGSFGPTPSCVQQARVKWEASLAAQPMDFFVRRLEGELYAVRKALGAFVGTQADHLALVDNATYGMNVVAESVELQPGDEVLLTDHEYGAVARIWNRACQRRGASLVQAKIPIPLKSADQVVDAIRAALTPRTRLLVISQITSATAITMPVAEIIPVVQAAGAAVCIDGPHAVAQLPLDLDALDCDFYTASCHKWLSAPLGTGFLYVHPRWQDRITPPVLSWGKTDQEETDARWTDEFHWLGTRDASALLAIPTAIDFLRRVGFDTFRARTHYLARYARRRLLEFADRSPIAPDDPNWYTAMAHLPLPNGPCRPLQNALWGRYGIEVPIIDFADQRWIRVSCHLYTQKHEIDTLVEALHRLL